MQTTAPRATTALAPYRSSGIGAAAGPHSTSRGATGRTATPATLLAVLGVVYGDIGTSPLYALRASLLHFASAGIERQEILGILSLILWSLVLVVTVKYALLILRADNRGEGGIMALAALAQRHLATERARWAATLLGIAGASLFFGDGVITPAISVLSAVEGLKVASPAFGQAVIPLSAAILVVLFLVQHQGTGAMGAVFGPVCALWFAAIGLMGLAGIAGRPEVLAALSPSYAAAFVVSHGFAGFVAFGSVFLAVTGAEALYADLGHFGRQPIVRMWVLLVLPALVLNYFGQGALILSDPAAIENPFYLLAPEALRLPLVFLASVATVFASQAVISGAYSLARQCIQLGFLPRLVVRHTSLTEEGQIYLPQVNVALLLGVLVLVLSFRNSDSLAAAYGVAVAGTFVCTTALAAGVFYRKYDWSRSLVALVFGPLLALDVLFFVSNTLKIPEGGWVPLVIGAALAVLMTTWGRGRALFLSRIRNDSLPLRLAREPHSRTIRVLGTAVSMTEQGDSRPSYCTVSRRKRVLFMAVLNENVPEVRNLCRMKLGKLAPGIRGDRNGFGESPGGVSSPRSATAWVTDRHAARCRRSEVQPPGSVPPWPAAMRAFCTRATSNQVRCSARSSRIAGSQSEAVATSESR